MDQEETEEMSNELNLTLPDFIERFEVFRNSLGEWCASINSEEKYSTAKTPTEALVAAICDAVLGGPIVSDKHLDVDDLEK